MFKKAFTIILLGVLMIFSIACSSTKDVKNEAKGLDIETGKKTLTEFLTAFKDKDLDKIGDLSMDRSFSSRDEFKKEIKEGLNAQEDVKSFEVLDNGTVISDYVTMSAILEMKDGTKSQIKFKIQKDNGQPIVYLKEFMEEDEKINGNK